MAALSQMSVQVLCAPSAVCRADYAYFSRTSRRKTESLTAASSPWDQKDLEGWGEVKDGEEKLQMQEMEQSTELC